MNLVIVINIHLLIYLNCEFDFVSFVIYASKVQMLMCVNFLKLFLTLKKILHLTVIKKINVVVYQYAINKFKLI